MIQPLRFRCVYVMFWNRQQIHGDTFCNTPRGYSLIYTNSYFYRLYFWFPGTVYSYLIRRWVNTLPVDNSVYSRTRTHGVAVVEVAVSQPVHSTPNLSEEQMLGLVSTAISISTQTSNAKYSLQLTRNGHGSRVGRMVVWLTVAADLRGPHVHGVEHLVDVHRGPAETKLTDWLSPCEFV